MRLSDRVVRDLNLDSLSAIELFMRLEDEFDLSLPQLPAGSYALYGDVVHANGFPETLVSRLTVPAQMQGAPLAADGGAAHGGSHLY